jgi:hypothetical protein
MSLSISKNRAFRIFAFIFACIPLLAFTQQTRRCGTYEYWQLMKQDDPSLATEEERINHEAREWMDTHRNRRDAASVITIPVVVHILYHTDEENLSDAVVQSQIDVLNQDFARLNQDAILTPAVWQNTAAAVGIQFCLASIRPDSVPSTGIERKHTDLTSWQSFNDMKFENQGGLNAWDRDHYMNIWVGNLEGNAIGITQMPYGMTTAATDGMCISYKTFGRIGNHLDSRYNLGRTVTHETGHWLGLYHIWGDDSGNCITTGGGSDLMDDTPDQVDNTYDCPVFPVTDACSPAYPGIMFMNYLDYTDDACMNMFTNDQAAKMRYVLDNIRTTIRDNVSSCSGAITVSLPIKLFPNPVSDDVLIHTYFNTPASVEFSLKDIFGRELIHQQKSLTSYEIVPFNVTSIPSGVYVVSVNANNYSLTQKVIVAHR